MIDSLGNVQSVLLVGGTSEIGKAILERFAAGGRLQRIVLLGRNEAALEATAESWRDRGVGPPWSWPTSPANSTCRC